MKQNKLLLKQLEIKDLNNVNESNIQFFVSVSNEFRTPVTRILENIARLANAELNDIEKKQIDNIHQNALCLIRLLNSFPDLQQGTCFDISVPIDYTCDLEGEKFSKAENNNPDNVKLFQALLKKISGSVSFEANEMILTSADERFLQKAIDLVKKNIGNSEFNIENMSFEIGISRVHLHRKLKAMTNQSPSEFVRTIRLKQAAYLLLQNKISISELAYAVGFSSHQYFTNCFQDHFNMSPTEYRNKYQTREPSHIDEVDLVGMNRACKSIYVNLYEQNIHASCIRPLKNNFVRMK